ncbi:MAG: hypothetical protein P1U87_05985 [Verrucomicrobiales bacterium]|nr:hypothetical protein [Verrucomicrobiales bacterium]
MSSDLPPETQDFLITWGATFAIAGLCFALIGIVAGWIIWKNTRKVTEEIEAGNRDALADYETTSDEVSKIRAELSGTTD